MLGPIIHRDIFLGSEYSVIFGNINSALPWKKLQADFLKAVCICVDQPVYPHSLIKIDTVHIISHRRLF